MLTLDVAVESYHWRIESNYIKAYGNSEHGHIEYIIASLPVFEKNAEPNSQNKLLFLSY